MEGEAPPNGGPREAVGGVLSLPLILAIRASGGCEVPARAGRDFISGHQIPLYLPYGRTPAAPFWNPAVRRGNVPNPECQNARWTNHPLYIRIKYMIQLYNVIFYQPIFNLLVWFYNVIPGHDIGVAIILLTILLKVLLYPLSQKALQSQKAMQTIQPKIKEIQEKYKDDKKAQTKAIMEFYSREKVSPFSSCLPLLIQFPFLIALYQALIAGLKSAQMEMLYPFVANPGMINVMTLGFLDLSKPNYVLAILAGLAQFWQGKMLQTTQPPKSAGAGAKDESMTATMNKQMLYFMPAITVFIGISLPGGLTLYWLMTTLLTIAQQWWFFKNDKKPVAIQR